MFLTLRYEKEENGFARRGNGWRGQTHALKKHSPIERLCFSKVIPSLEAA